MADIRINALTTTATSSASDDFIAIDGAANGTRKILASNIAQNVSDVVLGVNGPSVKSSLDARAARQGLVFDGTSGSTLSSLPAFGTSDFSVSAVVNGSSFSSVPRIIGGLTNSFVLMVLSNGTLLSSIQSVADNTASTGALTAGKNHLVTYVRSGTTGTYYIDGVAAGTTTDSRNYSAASTFLGASSSITTVVWPGVIESPLVYNRALSASEVVSLFEAGVPAGADYNTASNTSLSTSALTAATLYPIYSTFSSTATSFSAQDAAAYHAAATNAAFAVSVGQKILVSFTLTQNASDFPQVILNDSSSGADRSAGVIATAGANSIILTATSAGTVRVRFFSFAACNYSVANLSVTRLGLLLAPDAYQAGGGLAWYDTSGNAANITLPASGVSWNVPSSQKTASGWTYAGTLATTGNLTISGTGSNYFEAANLNPPALGSTGGSMKMLYQSQYGLISGVAGAGYGWMQVQRVDGTATAYSLVLQPNGGNLLLGTTTDGGQKLQVSGTASISGALSIGNTVTSAISVASTHKVTISIGGVTYYLLASNV